MVESRGVIHGKPVHISLDKIIFLIHCECLSDMLDNSIYICIGNLLHNISGQRISPRNWIKKKNPRLGYRYCQYLELWIIALRSINEISMERRRCIWFFQLILLDVLYSMPIYFLWIIEGIFLYNCDTHADETSKISIGKVLKCLIVTLLIF